MTARCKACDREIRFLRTIEGKALPVNFPPLHAFIVRDGYAHKVTAYVPHWSTCPHAEKFRRKDSTPKGQGDLFE